MARRLNVVLQKKLHSVADQVMADDPFTSCVVKAVTDRVWKTDFLGKTYNQAYQMVGHYLRGSHKYVKPQNRYTPKEMENLILMPTWARSEYALARGVTPAAVEQAINRYMVRHTFPAAPLSRNWFNFSRRSDLSSRGFTLDNVRACREYLEEECGLALRAPNILYHPKTKKRYTMSDTEQVALLTDPKQFLRLRAAHIKENWVEKDVDPIYDTEDAVTLDLSAPVTSASKRLVGRIRKLTEAVKNNPPSSVNSILYAALSHHVNFCLELLQSIEAEGGTK